MMWLMGLALADPGAHPLVGNRLQADGAGLGVAVSSAYVAGGDGGTFATAAVVRWGGEKVVLAARLPFASYRTPNGRTTNLGNLRLDAAYRLERGGGVSLFGVTTHLSLGSAYTWTNDAASLWPGNGINAVVQHRRGDRTAWLARAELGLHGSEGYAPFPEIYMNGSLAVGLDHDLGSRFGLTTEAAVAWWDPSPIDVATWVRAEPGEGIRLRVGLLLPIGTWAGLSPSEKAAGIREATMTADIALGL